MRALIYITLLLSLLSCSGNSPSDNVAQHDHSAEIKSGKKFSCPMHPQVVKDEPGTCPVCGMDLVEVSTGMNNSNDLMLNDSQIKLANITTRKVGFQNIGQTIVVNGRLVQNEELKEVISTRVAGRVERLYLKETGREVRKGEPLYQIYSEELLTLQREYLLAKDQYESLGSDEKRYKSFFEAAKRKLLLYGLSEGQISKLKSVNDIQPAITFLSTASGIVQEIKVTEGQYVQSGETLMEIENVSRLWVEADLYPNETMLVKVGDHINVNVNDLENKETEAVVEFLSPELRPGSQITVMRASIANPNQVYKPGMQAQVLFKHSSRKSLTVPVDAVIRDGKGAHVYLQRGRNTFRPVMVRLGLEDYGQLEITDGIKEGDTVAVTGAYLLYSEIVLKRGNDPMAGHTHN